MTKKVIDTNSPLRRISSALRNIWYSHLPIVHIRLRWWRASVRWRTRESRLVASYWTTTRTQLHIEIQHHICNTGVQTAPLIHSLHMACTRIDYHSYYFYYDYYYIIKYILQFYVYIATDLVVWFYVRLHRVLSRAMPGGQRLDPQLLTALVQCSTVQSTAVMHRWCQRGWRPRTPCETRSYTVHTGSSSGCVVYGTGRTAFSECL